MLTYESALKKILAAATKPQLEEVALAQAQGRRLARPVIAPCDLPLFDNAAVDGYALLLGQGSQAGRPQVFKIVGSAQAGRPFLAAIKPGQAVRILTGAKMPLGADCVVMQEHVEWDKNSIRLNRRPARGQNIRCCGEDVRKGKRVFEKGVLLRAQELVLLAALGFRRIFVYRHPRIAVITTGSELKPPGSRLKPGQIYDSNSTLLTSLVRENTAQLISLRRVPDRLSALTQTVGRAMAADCLIVAGGISVGDKDYVREAFSRCGVKTVFWRVNIKPGMPLFFGRCKGAGRRKNTLVFGLPGNPLSVYVTFQEFVRPALCRFSGGVWQDGYTHPAVLVSDLKLSRTRRTHFVRVKTVGSNGNMTVEPLKRQGSHLLHSLTQADGWIRISSNAKTWRCGSPVLVKQPEANEWH